MLDYLGEIYSQAAATAWLLVKCFGSTGIEPCLDKPEWLRLHQTKSWLRSQFGGYNGRRFHAAVGCRGSTLREAPKPGFGGPAPATRRVQSETIPAEHGTGGDEPPESGSSPTAPTGLPPITPRVRTSQTRTRSSIAARHKAVTIGAILASATSSVRRSRSRPVGSRLHAPLE